MLAVTDDFRFARELAEDGCEVIPDGASEDLNATLRQAAAEAGRRWPGATPVTLCADLPALVARRPRRRARRGGRTDVRARRRRHRHDGVRRARRTASTPHFGPGSAAPPPARRARARWSRPATTLRLDVDDLGDLGGALVLGRRPAHRATRCRAATHRPGTRTAGHPRGDPPSDAGAARTSWRSPSWRSSSSPCDFLAAAVLARTPSWPAPSWRGAWPWSRSSWPAPSWRGVEAFLAGAFFAAVDVEAVDFLAAAVLAGRLLRRRLLGRASRRRRLGRRSPAWPGVARLAAALAVPAATTGDGADRRRLGHRGRGQLGELLGAGDDVLEVLAGRELRHRLLLGLHPLAGLRVADPAGVADAPSRRSRSR